MKINWSAVYNHPATYLLLDMRTTARYTSLKFQQNLLIKIASCVSGLSSASGAMMNR